MEEKKTEADALFNAQAELIPERGEAEEEEESEVRHKTITEAENNPNKSDFNLLLDHLIVETGYKYLDNLQVSRVLPEAYMPRKRMLMKDLLLQNMKMGYAESDCLVDTVLSKGLDGDGILDLLQAYGSTKAAEQKESGGIV